jgi:hypothetical protein
MRVAGDALDPGDAYTSAWIGSKGGGRETILGGGGTPAIAIVGKSNNRECTGLGLLLIHRPAEVVRFCRSGFPA